MEASGKSCRPWLGGIISGIGICAILAAAAEQFTKFNLKNYTTVTMALGLAAIVLGCVIAHKGRGKNTVAEP